MRAWLLFAATVCWSCQPEVSLSTLLARTTTTVRLGVSSIKGTAWAKVQVSALSERGACPRLSSDVTATIGGERVDLERGTKQFSTPVEPIRCRAPSAGRAGLPAQKRGEVLPFVLEEGPTRLEAGLRLRSLETDAPVLAPFPGLGERWHVAWSGALPKTASFYGSWLTAEPVDGGFDLLLPRWKPTAAAPPLSLTFPIYEVEGCVGATCECKAKDSWDHELDGGVIRRQRWPPPDMFDF